MPINLLPRKKLDDSTGGKLLRWFLSTFRVIVIIVQVVVIAAFVTRVVLDTRIASLDKEIEQKHNLVKSYAQTEKTFLITQTRLNTYKSLLALENSYLTLLRAISSEVPVDTQLTSIQKANSLLIIKGNASNEASLYSFATRLESLSDLTDVRIVEIKDQLTTPAGFIIQATVPSLPS